ncbi:hypothetical protein J5L53_004843 [Salmonella enterica subsp. enterica serovar Weltevreden]|nr:hypothetical protein [Salmonella enterica subsp. enterica serovar Virchow]EHJ5716574.1 hypothetical protein [Salmonella enterica subsp. enterica serovar Weltevreden]EHJ5716620.1 hypothetical protein [Salmonella enterica subsp. enterica serovar Weltevreden]QIF72342.1 hypothetical protein EAE13_24365 [Escherichia coli]
MGSCAAPSAKGDDKFITTDYLQQCPFDGKVLRDASLKKVATFDGQNLRDASSKIILSADAEVGIVVMAFVAELI